MQLIKKYSYYILLSIYSVFGLLPNANSQNDTQNYLLNNKVVNVTDEIDENKFNTNFAEQIIFDNINKILQKRFLETFTINHTLKKAADDQAQYMANIDDVTETQTIKEKETTALRVYIHGGSMHAYEIVEKNNIKKGSIPFSYEKLCNDIVFKLFNNSKKAKLIQSNKYNYMGIGVQLNMNKKKVYISIVLGNYKTINDGILFTNKLPLPYTNKYFGLSAQDPKECRKIEKMDNAHELQNNLIVENNEIYFETDNVKLLKKIIREKKDGLSIDVLQEEQFICDNANIIDYNNLNRGILLKPVYNKKLFKKNIAEIKENKYAFKSYLGTLPEDISDNYELNLVLIQNKSMCQSLAPSFITQTEGTYTKKVDLLADTVLINSRFNYKPIADSIVLTFRIPFENKKYNYKATDIEPFLQSLNEPAFIINDLSITAYSSIEGNDKENKFLQEKRANSIVKALEYRQTEDISTEIYTAYNTDDFTNDISKTKHAKMASMSVEEVQKYIRDNKLKKDLEPILQNHRYAEIKMEATYDISGNNELRYVVKEFAEAIGVSDKELALSIQKFAIQKILNGTYNVSILKEMATPNEFIYAGMEMNRLYMLFRYKKISSEDFVTQVAALNELSPNNEYIAFNYLLNSINYSDNEYLINENNRIQSNIDQLYYTPLTKQTIDGLNVKYQFKILNASDTLTTDKKLKINCIEKIKEIVNIKEESMNNALKLAELFIENKDYTFACESLEPWVMKSTNEKVLFTYLSLCSVDEWAIHSQKFTKAMTKASQVNKKKYCDLFDGSKFSLRILENDVVKESYCKICNE